MLNLNALFAELGSNSSGVQAFSSAVRRGDMGAAIALATPLADLDVGGSYAQTRLSEPLTYMAQVEDGKATLALEAIASDPGATAAENATARAALAALADGDRREAAEALAAAIAGNGSETASALSAMAMLGSSIRVACHHPAGRNRVSPCFTVTNTGVALANSGNSSRSTLNGSGMRDLLSSFRPSREYR